MSGFEFVSHTADIAMRVWAPDLPGLMRAAALGLAAALAGLERLEPHRAPSTAPRVIETGDAPDEEGLLVTFLNELIYQGEIHKEVYGDVEIQHWSLDTGVRALAYPDPALVPSHSVKAATYYDLHIVQTPSGLEATIVLDV